MAELNLREIKRARSNRISKRWIGLNSHGRIESAWD